MDSCTIPRAIIALWSCPWLSSLMSRSDRSSRDMALSASSTMSMSSTEVVHPACGWRPIRTASATVIENTFETVFGT